MKLTNKRSIDTNQIDTNKSCDKNKDASNLIVSRFIITVNTITWDSYKSLVRLENELFGLIFGMILISVRQITIHQSELK